MALSATGPPLRASGVEWDLRRAQPYLGYETYDFEIPVGTIGDVYDRYLVRMEEMRQSLRILRQALARIPDGPINADAPKVVLPPKEKVLSSTLELYEYLQVEHAYGGSYKSPGRPTGSASKPRGTKEPSIRAPSGWC